MRVSVVIPTYQRRDLLRRTLDRLLGQRFDDFELVVAVDGSTDGTLEMLAAMRDARLVVVAQPNRGPAAARNLALARARGELGLFLDDDILCEPDLLAVHAAAHEGAEARLVFGPILVAAESPRSLATEWTRLHTADYVGRLEREGEPRAELDAYVDANSSVPLSAVRAAGGFDDSLMRQCETADLGLRLWKAGVRFVYEPRAIVRHVFAKSARDLVETDAHWSGRNELILARKHPELRTRSPLALIGEGSPVKRALRAALVRSPVDPDIALAAPMAIAERLAVRDAGTIEVAPAARSAPTSVGRVVPAGVALLRARQGVATYRAAAQASCGWPRLRRSFGQRLPTLVYHYVGPRPHGLPASLAVAPEQFERQIGWLSRAGYRGVRASDWLAWLLGEGSLPDRPLLIAFDDAFAATAEHALPALRDRGWGATVFAVSRQTTNAWDGGELPLMDADALRRWARQGVEIGAHGRTHRALPGLPRAKLENEVVGARRDLEDALGVDVTSFAYPYGQVDAAAMACARESYGLAFGTDQGTAWLGGDRWRLPRSMALPTDGPLDLLARAELGWSPPQRLRARLGRLLGR